jgi:hypothetical protein
MATNAELLDLLREARETLRDFAENWDCDTDAHQYGTTCRVCAAKEAKDRIDAALAERLDSAKDVVESEVEWNNYNAQFSTAYPDDETSLTVCRFDLTQQNWRWDMEREVKKRGYCATEAEAKSAAIAAARGMR